MNYCFAIIALLLYALPASAAEPTQTLLAELTRPNAPVLAAMDMPALVPTAELGDDPGLPVAPVAELFTLEELKGKSVEAAELDLPEVELPLSDIPLARGSFELGLSA